MINLISLEEKKKHLTEYRLRLGVTISFALAALVGSSLLLLAPSYVLAILKENFAAGQVAQLQSKVTRSAQEQDINNQIKDINRKVDVYLRLGKTGRVVLSDTILKLLALRQNSITISSIFYDPGATTERIVLIGVAHDRDSLASFTDSLQKEGTFPTVTLPISSYVKSTDISFSIALDRSTVAKK